MLLDTGGGGGSYISYHYLLEKGFHLNSELPAPIKLADRWTTTYYSQPILEALIMDSTGEKQWYMIPFKVIELTGHDILLGQTWLSTIGVDINCSATIWCYPINLKIKIENPHWFSKISQNE